MSFGEKLSHLRKEKGMSQEDLANSLNVSRQAVSKWESNSSYPETDKIVAICKLFECSMDELIGLKEGKTKKENKILNTLNNCFDMVIKSIKLFYSMTFKQKIKCLIEIAFYILILFCFFAIMNSIIIEIITKLLYLLPNELLIILIQTFQGVLYLFYLIIGLYIIVKLYRVRYLDYYEEYNEKQEVNEVEKREDKEETKINIKEEKIIIRDPNSAFTPFSWIKKSCIIIIKLFASFFGIGFVIAFVILIACTIFLGSFINYGLLILYCVLGLIGALLCLYTFIEIIVRFIFNIKQSPKRLFIMFILSMVVIGLSGGFFASELTTYSIVDKLESNTIIYEETIEMQENLVIDFLNSYDTEIIYENRDDIAITFYGPDLNISYIETQKFNDETICTCNTTDNCFNYTNYSYYINHYFNGLSLNDSIKELLKYVKNKTIITDDAFYRTYPKIYISETNYNKILQNIKERDKILLSCE